MNLSVRIPSKPVQAAPRNATAPPKASARRRDERRVVRAREQLVADWLRSLSSR